jgi:hypothetical protein
VTDSTLDCDNDGKLLVRFFDRPDKYRVNVNLWMIGAVAIYALDLFFRANLRDGTINFRDNFAERICKLFVENQTLQAELKATDKFKMAEVYWSSHTAEPATE